MGGIWDHNVNVRSMMCEHELFEIERVFNLSADALPTLVGRSAGRLPVVPVGRPAHRGLP